MWKKVRAALGIGITWAAGWSIWGVALALLVSRGPEFTFSQVAPLLGIACAVWGFVGGTVFSAILSSVYGQRSIQQLPPLALAGWGGLAAALGPGVLSAALLLFGVQEFSFTLLGGVVLLFAVPGAMSSALTIGVAQWASPEPEDMILSRILTAPNTTCPECGYAVKTEDIVCSNYPRGRIGGMCGSDLEWWRSQLSAGTDQDSISATLANLPCRDLPDGILPSGSGPSPAV
jgi:hypothetical protein